MIEEMYKEEFADSPQDSGPSLASSSMGREGIAADQAEDWKSSKDHFRQIVIYAPYTFRFCTQGY